VSIASKQSGLPPRRNLKIGTPVQNSSKVNRGGIAVGQGQVPQTAAAGKHSHLLNAITETEETEGNNLKTEGRSVVNDYMHATVPAEKSARKEEAPTLQITND